MEIIKQFLTSYSIESIRNYVTTYWSLVQSNDLSAYVVSRCHSNKSDRASNKPFYVNFRVEKKLFILEARRVLHLHPLCTIHMLVFYENLIVLVLLFCYRNNPGKGSCKTLLLMSQSTRFTRACLQEWLQ